MKTQKFKKRLVLSKETIVNLVNGEMQVVQGGKTVFPSCNGCPYTEFPACDTQIVTICYTELC